jgi:hypothetical protein
MSPARFSSISGFEMKKSYQRFYIGIFIPIFLFAAYFEISARLLKAAGEDLSMEDTIARINDTSGYYGSALSQRTFYFKEHLYRRLQPDVVTLGSSRVLQFRADKFSSSFINLGGMSGLDEADEIARALFATHPPKLLIFGVDFWWFNPVNEHAASLRSPEEAHLRVTDLLQPPLWLASGKMTFQDAGSILAGKVPNVGITAILRKDGFDRFGAYYYTSSWTGARESEDNQFSTTFKRVRAGDGLFSYGDKLSEARWKKFEDLLDFLDSHGIKTVLFAPPLAPSVLDAMNKQRTYAYEPLMRERLEKTALRRGLPFFDFHDLRAIGSSDCEFTDGLHGGQIAYDRILMRMAVSNVDIRKIVKLPDIAAEIQKFAGHSSVLKNETDFLNLACIKTTHLE